MTVNLNRRGLDIKDIVRFSSFAQLPALIGNIFFLDPVNGNDSNSGQTPYKAFKTLAVAYAALTAEQNDVLFYIPGSSDVTISDTLTWAKNKTHFVGISAPVISSNTATITTESGETFATFITISANSCVFANLQFIHAQDEATSLTCLNLTGGGNFFQNVHVLGMGNATQGGQAGAQSMLINGGDRNLFDNCSIGTSQIARSAANAEIKFDGAAAGNVFRNCNILSYATAAGHYFVNASAAADDMSEYTLFDNCSFLNAPNMASQATMTTAFKLHASLAATILLKNCTVLGATDLDGDDTGSLYVDGAAPTNNTSGLAVASSAT